MTRRVGRLGEGCSLRDRDVLPRVKGTLRLLGRIYRARTRNMTLESTEFE